MEHAVSQKLSKATIQQHRATHYSVGKFLQWRRKKTVPSYKTKRNACGLLPENLQIFLDLAANRIAMNSVLQCACSISLALYDFSE